jgi:ABC-type antimicrobial peptide transport system permease subunit
MALGADRRQITGQTLLESVILALPGGAAGTAITAFTVAALNRAKPLVLDRYPQFRSWPAASSSSAIAVTVYVDSDIRRPARPYANP